jgi:GrpB-like predicted nucleotidyltransferase (UPF0157 family)
MKIEIVDYQTRWPSEFASWAARLRVAFGDDALRIDHIGSTSVPGLAAKDIIDVQVTVAALDDARIRRAFSAAGVRFADWDSDHCPPGLDLPPVELEKRGGAARETPPRANVHVRVDGRFNQQFPLLFRDYVRARPDVAAAYAAVKRALADRFADDVDSYYAIKDPAVDLIMGGAREWAATNQWRAGPSDG